MNNSQIFYCYTREEFNSNPYTSRKEEYDYSMRQNNVCYYDKKNDIFYNKNKEEVVITGKRVLLRTYISEFESALDAIERKGGIPVNSKDDIERIKNWQKEISTERPTFTVSGRDILENDNVKKQIVELAIDEEFFLKTKEKDFNGVISIDELYEYERGLLSALELHKDDQFIVSEKLSIEKDSLGNLEYRCFIVDGEILNISRNLFLTYHGIPKLVKVEANKILERIKKIKSFPTTFALDIVAYQIPHSNLIYFDILELNPIEATGEYLYNTVYKDSVFNTKFQKDALATELDILKEEAINNVPIYKNSKSLSFSVSSEPKDVIRTNFNEGSFNYNYYCAKKFGKADMSYFYTHHFLSFGNGLGIDIVDILTGKVRIKDALRYIKIELEQNGICTDSPEFQARINMDEADFQKKISKD